MVTIRLRRTSVKRVNTVLSVVPIIILSLRPMPQASRFLYPYRAAGKGRPAPVLDVETTGKQSPQELKAAVKTWLDRVEAHYGVKPFFILPINSRNAISAIPFSMLILIG